MVATPDLAIAKAALLAALHRADPNSLTRGAVEEFIQLLDKTVDECSRPNVQKCKNWIVANVAPSSGRAAILAKFLVALSESMETGFDRPSVRRRRLHVLYIVNDVLYHVVVRQGDRKFAGALDAHLPGMVATASTFEQCPKHLNKVQDLIALWEEREYLGPALISRLRQSFTHASDKNSGTRIQMSSEALKIAKEAPYMMPSVHGDSSAPWSDMPPSSWLAQLAPDSTLPMRRALLRPIQLVPGPAAEALAGLVKAALLDANGLYSNGHLQDRAHVNVNLLGEVEKPGEPNGEAAGASTYWGWSRRLCLRMKKRQKSPKNPPQPRRSRSRTRSSSARSSRNGSPQPTKRRRFSSRSQSRDRSFSPGPRRSRSSSRGRSPSRTRGGNGSYSRSRSPAARRGRSLRRRSHTRSPSRSGSRSGPPSRRSPPPPGSFHDRDSRAPQQPVSAPAHGFSGIPPQGPRGFPVPPPPPPPIGYQGTFPPPPPPPPQGWNPSQPGFVPPQMMGTGWGASPVPLPPPPPPYNGHQQHNIQWGRGNGRGGGGGGSRGYRGRGRGGKGRGGYSYGPR